MENFFLLEKDTYARHVGIPAVFLKNFVITERSCNGQTSYGFGIKIDSGHNKQNNMFFDILKHKIAETSFRVKNSSSGFESPIMSQSCRTFQAFMKFKNGMIVLETPYRRKYFEMPYNELEKLYQKYIFSDRNYLNEGKNKRKFLA